MPEDYDFDAAIVHPHRVCEVDLFLTSSQLQRLASAMQEQFPTLIHLKFGIAYCDSSPAWTLPLLDGFLGGSAPRLQSLELDSIPFPALPKLLLSATDLVRLTLQDIPHSGYFSPEAIVTGLSVLTNLRYLTIRFESPLSRPDRENRRPPPVSRSLLPALTHFEFQGDSRYLEDLVVRIDSPLLGSIWITFFHQLIFDIPRLAQFMMRTTIFGIVNEACMDFNYHGVQVGFSPRAESFQETIWLRISCTELDWQVSSLAQVCAFFPSIYTVEHLYISGPQYLPSQWLNDVENMQWLEIFHPLPSVKNLYVCKEFAQSIVLALQELVVERVTEVFPALETLFLEELQPSGPVQEAIGQFVAARQLLGHPVGVSDWNRSQGVLLR
jgi:hypothetical protein